MLSGSADSSCRSLVHPCFLGTLISDCHVPSKLNQISTMYEAVGGMNTILYYHLCLWSRLLIHHTGSFLGQ